ncbi:hypothetical protein SEUCBS140593_008331 [Sporothrix eucalyptigena]|uniref:F-box domain-containing protein n=1 Tax=Sporothrix eucalyptigena TaxID=1812306 RepID=A0ABP0CKN5_9PEZI
MTLTNAATKFGTLPELLGLLASQVRSRKQLARMRLVSRAFAAVVAPFLFDEVRIVQSDLFRVLRDLYNFEHVGYVKKLTIDGCDDHEGCNAVLQDGLLAKMPHLESFTWNQMPLAPGTLRVLHESCPCIKAIHVTFHKEMGERELGYSLQEPTLEHLRAREQFGRPDMSFFFNLEELTLHNLLPLLRLEFLSLGTGMGMGVDESTWLEALTDLKHLREVYVYNGGIYAYGCPVRIVYEDAFDSVYFTFDMFRPARCPHLRWFTVDRYEFDVYAFLTKAAADDPAWARRLAVSARDMGNGLELATLLQTIDTDDLDDDKQFLAAPVHLRMLDVDLQRNALELYVCKGNGEDSLPTTSIAPSVQQVLDDLVAGDDGTLEGLTVHLEERRAANEYGEPGCGVGVEFMRLGLLAASVAPLTNLTQLAIQSDGEVFSKSYLPEEKLVDAAVLLAVAVPSLRYIKVCQLCWRIWRDNKGGDGDENKNGNVRLELLEDREITDVELFSHTIWEVE